MRPSSSTYDAIVVGGGFYGVVIALYLVRKRDFKKVAIIEQESSLLARASYNNQARVHNGYHYPRSFTTAFRSRINFPKFIADWPDVTKSDFTKLYAIARRNSKVTSKQFHRFCQDIGAAVDLADTPLKKLFNHRLIEEVFVVTEFAFNSTLLASWAKTELSSCGVEVVLNSRVSAMHQRGSDLLQLYISTPNGETATTECGYVFNCTYSGLNQFRGDYPQTVIRLKHEITEMGLIELPRELANLGITVMDGPFFSIMPFPARNLSTLSHVRYTPHAQWQDLAEVNPYEKLANYQKHSRVERMIRDASRYIPLISEVRHEDSLFEVKTVLTKNESDDGRPILFERHHDLPRCISVLGGKIDNIYDILEKLDSEHLAPLQPEQTQGVIT